MVLVVCWVSMNQRLFSLHPNPGWGVSSSLSKGENDQTQATPPHGIEAVGKHCILELYDCDRSRLDDQVFLRDAIAAAADCAGATLLHLITHRFEPQGVTGLALLAESHISIHTWPESGYAAVDVFTCGDHTMPEKACQALCMELVAGHHKLTSFRREAPGSISGEDRLPLVVAA